jgi:hypothetical protein
MSDRDAIRELMPEPPVLPVINTPLTRQELKAVCHGLDFMIGAFAQLDATPDEYGLPSRKWCEELEERLRKLLLSTSKLSQSQRNQY